LPKPIILPLAVLYVAISTQCVRNVLHINVNVERGLQILSVGSWLCGWRRTAAAAATDDDNDEEEDDDDK